MDHEAWYVDTASVAVGGLWLDGPLWLVGETVQVTIGASASLLSSGDETPPGLAASTHTPWVKVSPVVGSRIVVVAGAARCPPPIAGDREAVLDACLARASPPKPSRFARWFGTRAPPVEGAALVIDIDDVPPAENFASWLSSVREQGVDLSWAGNEGGPGLVHALRRPMNSTSDVRAALLDHAREDAELSRLVRESAEVWIEDSGEVAREAGRLVADDPTRGWIEDLDLDTIATNVCGTAGAWLDPFTGHARRAWSRVLSGTAIVRALGSHLEDPTIVAVHSAPAPADSVMCVHLIGGIDRASGELVGFALQRVWT